MKKWLDFDDVLLLPRKSDVYSREQVDTSVQLDSGSYLKIPVIASPMKGIINRDFVSKLSDYGIIGILHRFYDDQQERFADIIRINQLVDIFDFNPEEIPILLHLKLMKKVPLLTKHRIEAIQWIQLIIDKNKTINYFNQSILEQFLLMCINWSLNPQRVLAGNSEIN